MSRSTNYLPRRAASSASLEINPMVLTKSGGSSRPIAASRLMITGAVGRHPELGIEIAREFDQRRRLSSRSLTPSNKTIIAHILFSHSWQRRQHRKGSNGLVGFTAPRWRLDDVDGCDR